MALSRPASRPKRSWAARWGEWRGLLAASVPIAATVIALVIAAHLTGVTQPVERFAFDRAVGWRTIAGPDDPPRAVVVAIREPLIAEAGWPLPDAVLATALDRVVSSEPAAIGVDVYRDRPVGGGQDALTAQLSRSLDRGPPVIWISQFGDAYRTAIAPPDVLAGTDRTGFADQVLDPDGVVRRGLLYLTDGERFAEGFALRLARALLVRDGIEQAGVPDDPAAFRLGAALFQPLEAHDGGYRHADAGGYQTLLDHRRSDTAIPVIDLQTVLDGEDLPEAIASRLQGRVVLIGSLLESVKDTVRTPRASGHTSHGETPGVVLHALIVDNIVRLADGTSAPTASLPERAEIALAIGAAIIGLLLALGPFNPAGALLAGIGVAAAILAGWIAAFRADVWMPLAPPLFGFALTYAAVAIARLQAERRDRETLRSLFASHVSGDVVDAIWAERADILRAGGPSPRRQPATILIADIAGFTSIIERHEPARTIPWLNDFMAAMSDTIAAHGGVVLRFFGDSVLAVFGVPARRESAAEIAADAQNAVACARAMAGALVGFNARSQALGIPPVTVRIGVHTGPVVAGSLGGASRREYCVNGDTVNTAARLESYARSFDDDAGNDSAAHPCRIAISAAVAEHLTDPTCLRPRGEAVLKGKEEKVSVYQVILDPSRAKAGEGGNDAIGAPEPRRSTGGPR